MKQKIIIDTDPGIDDAMAIHQAFADERLEVLGLTTIFGNVFVEQATRNALWLVEQANYQNCPVAQGASKPLVQAPKTPSFHVHGKEGFGYLPAPKPKGQADKQKAHRFLSEMCRNYPKEIIICAIGPLTNIALLLKYDPEIVHFVKKIVIMGGAVFCKGNITPYAEANIWNDPHAASEVMAANWNVEMIGLDVTGQIHCSEEIFCFAKKKSPIINGFLFEISQFYLDFYTTVSQKRICKLHDPSAVLAITDRDLFDFESHCLMVVLANEKVGQTQIAQGTNKVSVAVSTNPEKAINRYLTIISNADQKRKNRESCF